MLWVSRWSDLVWGLRTTFAIKLYERVSNNHPANGFRHHGHSSRFNAQARIRSGFWNFTFYCGQHFIKPILESVQPSHSKLIIRYLIRRLIHLLNSLLAFEAKQMECGVSSFHQNICSELDVILRHLAYILHCDLPSELPDPCSLDSPATQRL